MTRRKVFLSPLAEKKLLLLLEWLEENWSSKVKEEFILKLKSSVEQISVYPESCMQSNLKKGLYRYVITKKTSFYFRIVKTDIEIITLFDNRQNPKQINKELKSFFKK